MSIGFVLKLLFTWCTVNFVLVVALLVLLHKRMCSLKDLVIGMVPFMKDNRKGHK